MRDQFRKKAPPGKKCNEASAPVACGNGKCESDYIACLKAMSRLELGGVVETKAGEVKVQVADEASRSRKAMVSMLKTSTMTLTKDDGSEDDGEDHSLLGHSWKDW